MPAFRPTFVATACAALALAGCGHTLPPSAAAAGQAPAAKSFFHFHRPQDYVLAPAAHDPDFDHALAIARQAAAGWDSRPALVWAYHLPAYPHHDGTKVPARTYIGQAAGLDTLCTQVNPETVVFGQTRRGLLTLVIGAFDADRLVPEARALATARATGKLKSLDPLVLLFRFRGASNPVFGFCDNHTEDPTAARENDVVAVDAYTGERLVDEQLAAQVAGHVRTISGEPVALEGGRER